jgi:hypothetical protein
MTCDLLEQRYSHMTPDEDGGPLIGKEKGIVTVGQIREACQGHPKGASICPDDSPAGFFIMDSPGKFFTAPRII